MELRSKIGCGQEGLSLTGFIFVIAILAVVAILGLRVVPTVVEYSAIKKAMAVAKGAGTSALEIRSAFDKHKDAGYIESVSGKDLEITRSAQGLDVSVAYQKRIGLFGPVSLLIDYVASTADTSGK